MNKLGYIAIFSLYCSYVPVGLDNPRIGNGMIGQSQEDLIENTFHEIDSLLKIDNGHFWGHQLYGPILMVDPVTRKFFANQNSATDDFKKTDGIYSGTLPSKINIANTAEDWNGERWTMIMLPLPEDKAQRNGLVIHELFHRIQPDIGFGYLSEADNGHLDTYLGRVLLRLEMEALKAALAAEDNDSMVNHLKAGLTFRDIRQSDVVKNKAENSLELNEGLAEYTAIALGGNNDKGTRARLIGGIDQFYENPTYVRSFAYHTIPVYGFLLAKQQSDWQNEITSDTDLANFFKKAFDVVANMGANYEKLAEECRYDLNNIVGEERRRELARLAKITEYEAKFLKGPTLKLTFENMNISFDPRNILPLENVGTVYPNLRVTDNWGILTVENGALLSADWSHVIVSVPTELNENALMGDGWKLELAPGWKVQRVNGKPELRKSE